MGMSWSRQRTPPAISSTSVCMPSSGPDIAVSHGAPDPIAVKGIDILRRIAVQPPSKEDHGNRQQQNHAEHKDPEAHLSPAPFPSGFHSYYTAAASVNQWNCKKGRRSVSKETAPPVCTSSRILPGDVRNPCHIPAYERKAFVSFSTTSCAPPSTMEVEDTRVSLAFSWNSGMERAPQLHMVERTFAKETVTLSFREPA